MAKKSFKGDNPAMAFINSTPDQPKGTQGTQHTYKAQEARSKRLNLLLTPSLHEGLTRIARVEGTSLNELINVVLEKHAQQNKEALEKYAEIWGDK